MNLITTMVSSWFRGLVPLFEYTAKRAYNCHVRVFDKDELFPKYHKSTVALLRFLVPNRYFKKYDYVYFTDADFIFVPQRPSLFDYHKRIIKESRVPYSGFRGPVKKKGVQVWRGNYGRIGGGCFMVAQEWFDATRKWREKYLEYIKDKKLYREEDEVYLFSINRKSGLKVPKKPNHFLNGKKFDINYRSLHLGDFKQHFSRWRKVKTMKRRFLSDACIKGYLKLLEDKEFRTLREKAMLNENIRTLFNNLDHHLSERCLKEVQK